MRKASWSGLALRFFAPLGLVLALSVLGTQPARADFRVCNNTSARIGLAMGYNDGRGWVTEGWFNLRPNRCDSVFKGDLSASFYYVYAVDYDHGGEWGGKSYMCTREREFTIRGSGNCLARGYDRTGFFEINTGRQHNWTVEINENGQTSGTR
jgi:uncharacterized membrane protein